MPYDQTAIMHSIFFNSFFKAKPSEDVISKLRQCVQQQKPECRSHFR